MSLFLKKSFFPHITSCALCFQDKGQFTSARAKKKKVQTFLSAPFRTASRCRNPSDNTQTLFLAERGGREGGGEVVSLAPRWKPFESQQSGFWVAPLPRSVANDWPDSCSQKCGHGHQTHANSVNRPFFLGESCAVDVKTCRIWTETARVTLGNGSSSLIGGFYLVFFLFSENNTILSLHLHFFFKSNTLAFWCLHLI